MKYFQHQEQKEQIYFTKSDLLNERHLIRENSDGIEYETRKYIVNHAVDGSSLNHQII